MRSFESVLPGVADALRPSDWRDAVPLSAGVEIQHQVPTDTGSTGSKAVFVIFAATGDFYVDYDRTVALPASHIVDGTAPDLNPTQRYLGGSITAINLIAPSDCVVVMNFYTR